MYCHYYQATALPSKIWFITGCLRNENHWTLDRSFDSKNRLEFFVAPDFEEEFLSLMKFFESKGYISDLKKMENRFTKPSKVAS